MVEICGLEDSIRDRITGWTVLASVSQEVWHLRFQAQKNCERPSVVFRIRFFYPCLHICPQCSTASREPLALVECAVSVCHPLTSYVLILMKKRCELYPHCHPHQLPTNFLSGWCDVLVGTVLPWCKCYHGRPGALPFPLISWALS